MSSDYRETVLSQGRCVNGCRPTCCASAADEGARHRMLSKKTRSRAPKAVSCKRLLGGRAL